MPYQITWCRMTGWGSGVSDQLPRDASCGILVGVRHYFHCILFFSDESDCEALKNYLKYLKRLWSWHHTLPPRCFKVYVLHTLRGQREDLKTQHLLGSVEKRKVKIAKSEAIFFILSFESNLCSELSLNLHPIFLLGATSCFAWKWN